MHFEKPKHSQNSAARHPLPTTSKCSDIAQKNIHTCLFVLFNMFLLRKWGANAALAVISRHSQVHLLCSILILIDPSSLSTPTHSLDAYQFWQHFSLIPHFSHVGACWCQPSLCLVGTSHQAISTCATCQSPLHNPCLLYSLDPQLRGTPVVTGLVALSSTR